MYCGDGKNGDALLTLVDAQLVMALVRKIVVTVLVC